VTLPAYVCARAAAATGPSISSIPDARATPKPAIYAAGEDRATAAVGSA
jgi:hypothetical protein